MTRVWILLTLLLATGVTFGQTVPKPPKGVEAKYDRFKDTTTVSMRGVGRGYASMDIVFFYDGQTISKDVEDFYLVFSAFGRCSGFCFNRADLILLIDGQRERLSYIDALTDRALFVASREILTRIANADTVEYQVGSRDGKVRDDGPRRIRELLEYARKPD